MRYEVKVKEIHVGYIVVEANDEKEAIKKAYDHLADVEDEFQTMKTERELDGGNCDVGWLACLLLGVWKEIDGGKKNVVDSAEDASMMGLFVGWDAARLTATMLVAKR